MKISVGHMGAWTCIARAMRATLAEATTQPFAVIQRDTSDVIVSCGDAAAPIVHVRVPWTAARAAAMLTIAHTHADTAAWSAACDLFPALPASITDVGDRRGDWVIVATDIHGRRRRPVDAALVARAGAVLPDRTTTTARCDRAALSAGSALASEWGDGVVAARDLVAAGTADAGAILLAPGVALITTPTPMRVPLGEIAAPQFEELRRRLTDARQVRA